MIFKRKPKFLKTLKFLNKADRLDPKDVLEYHGRLGVSALAAATPKDTGEASSRWSYKVEGSRERYTLSWTNDDMAGRVPLVIILQYGHATKSGGYVMGRDFINPALRPVYESLKKTLIQEVL